MKESEVVVLLGGLSEFQHQQVNDVSVQMWANTLAGDMTVQFALGYAAHHFAKSQDSLKPADFNRAWNERQERAYWDSQRQVPELDDHVGDAGFEYRSDPSTGFLPVQKTSRATPQVVELFFAAWHDAKKGGRSHPDGTPFGVQDYFNEVLPLMQDAARSSREDALERHCGKKACMCTHNGNCYRGWMEGERYDDGRAHPCVVCRESLYDVLRTIPGPGDRNDADFATLRSHAKSDHYEQS